MEPDRLEGRLRRALEPPDEVVARTVRESLVPVARVRSHGTLRLAWAATALGVVLIALVLSGRPAARNPSAEPDPAPRVVGRGRLVLLEDPLGNRVTIVGGDRRRDRFRTRDPRILIAQGGSR